jgi:glycosyltransferase involved in cell wall biosynthesis
MNKHVHILGTRGVPAAHSGFEYFAEHYALYLVGSGWKVTVYCQLDGDGPIYEDEWRGVHRVNIPITNTGALGTIYFDWKATLISAKRPGTILTLGYNTAIFGLIYRLKGIRNVINMDGIEWRRAKWGPLARAWFYANDWLGCWLGNHLVADHPEIKRHLETRVRSSKISMIPYGATEITEPPIDHLTNFDLEPREYAIVIARPVPENSLYEIVSAFSSEKRNKKLVVLGNYDRANDFHRRVLEAASEEIIFVGAIFDKDIVKTLRYHACFYIHGHTVGGTNPSLVEALAASSPVLANDNKYNRWVIGSAGEYFTDIDSCSAMLKKLFDDPIRIEQMSQDSLTRCRNEFSWPNILKAYESLM